MKKALMVMAIFWAFVGGAVVNYAVQAHRLARAREEILHAGSMAIDEAIARCDLNFQKRVDMLRDQLPVLGGETPEKPTTAPAVYIGPGDRDGAIAFMCANLHEAKRLRIEYDRALDSARVNLDQAGKVRKELDSKLAAANAAERYLSGLK